MQFVALDAAVTIDDVDIPGFKLHPLKGTSQHNHRIEVGGLQYAFWSFESLNGS